MADVKLYIDTFKYIYILCYMNTVDKVAIFKSLADNTRLAIVRRLAQDQCAVASADIVDTCSQDLQLSQPTMSHHFGKLVQSGLLIERKLGVGKSYQLNKKLLDEVGLNVNKL